MWHLCGTFFCRNVHHTLFSSTTADPCFCDAFFICEMFFFEFGTIFGGDGERREIFLVIWGPRNEKFWGRVRRSTATTVTLPTFVVVFQCLTLLKRVRCNTSAAPICTMAQPKLHVGKQSWKGQPARRSKEHSGKLATPSTAQQNETNHTRARLHSEPGTGLVKRRACIGWVWFWSGVRVVCWTL